MPGVPIEKIDILESFKDKILREYPRLSLETEFKFACHPEVPCFGKCCANVNIFLTPYDVLRMKNTLGLTSAEFLEKYTVPLMLEENQLPVVVLKMNEDEEKKCPFVSEKGCNIYEDRPWSCRMYPLGLASAKKESGEGEEFCFIVEEKDSLCEGFKEDREWTVEEWLKDQDINEFNRKSESYMQLTMHPHFQKKEQLDEKKIKAFFRTCYDLDGFREMLFGSSFFDRFEIKDETKEKIRTDDEELLEFGITKWLRFAVFHEDTMIVKDEELEKRVQSLGWRVETIEDLEREMDQRGR